VEKSRNGLVMSRSSTKLINKRVPEERKETRLIPDTYILDYNKLSTILYSVVLDTLDDTVYRV
jgi:hypothetical protein